MRPRRRRPSRFEGRRTLFGDRLFPASLGDVLFDFFRRSAPTTPADVLALLVRVASKEQWDRLTSLCSEHRDVIRDSFASWAAVPDEIRKATEAKRRRYVSALIAVARIFDANGDPSLLSGLRRDDADSPIIQWQRDLADAQSMLDGGRDLEAVALLERIVSTNSTLLGGTAVDRYLPMTLGMLGSAYHHLGNIDRATACMTRAKALCEAAGDQEGVAVYEGNLRFLDRLD
jgi:hypothetical protein